MTSGGSNLTTWPPEEYGDRPASADVGAVGWREPAAAPATPTWAVGVHGTGVPHS